jgi:hypothetical protein
MIALLTSRSSARIQCKWCSAKAFPFGLHFPPFPLKPILQVLDLLFDFLFTVSGREEYVIRVFALVFPFPLHPVKTG